jgi:hypothetical protein
VVRHYLVAMVLLATYLMMPPPRVVGDHFQTTFAPPLSEWVQLRLFDSDAECEAALGSYRQKPPGGLPHASQQNGRDLCMRAAKCISTRDPRLK